jgi:hypothetical protein
MGCLQLWEVKQVTQPDKRHCCRGWRWSVQLELQQQQRNRAAVGMQGQV